MLVFCCYRKGVIAQVKESEFVVDVSGEATTNSLRMSELGRASKTAVIGLSTEDTSTVSHTLHLPPVAASAEKLLDMASSNLRCIDGDKITFDLMASNLSGSTDPTSRPVAVGETIDYFMSHSWHDDPVDKFNKLRALCERFQQRHNRQPTFWLDKVIDPHKCTH